MRMRFEVIAVGVDVAKFPRKNGSGVDEVPFVWVSGLDTDYMDQLVKLKVFRSKSKGESEWLKTMETMKQTARKGAWLDVQFKTMKQDDRFEHCTVITVQPEDVKVVGAQPGNSAQVANGSQSGNGVQPAQVMGEQKPGMSLAA